MTKNEIKTETAILNEQIGYRMCIRRQYLGYSQAYLGKKLGLTYQQINKYEKGKIRMPVGRLWEISKILKVPISFFLEKYPNENDRPKEEDYLTNLVAEQIRQVSLDNLRSKELMEILRAYCQIKDRHMARFFYQSILATAKILEPSLATTNIFRSSSGWSILDGDDC